ncbi:MULTISPECIES: YdcF family protein [unclassified Pseudoalteromonas]|uniref:YdcF family protein n=1 Tax=unclassified Pseudoalteromonas TaxID=194690 RepID=UPI0013FD14DC|nr:MULTISPECIES: YdcF family protein [unclassified Pseudoalteromonas]MBH0050799.1 YdcF family protein [Pseudoalteromonas sp. SWYJZ19]
MFVIKKLIGGLLMPLPLFGLFTCLMLLLAFKGRKSALFLSTLSLVVLLTLSTPFIANLIIHNNEPVSLAFNTLKHPKIDKIVVLGCDINPNSALSSNNQLGNCALTRLVEGIKLAKHYPNAELIVSGGGYQNTTNSGLMYQTAISLGITKSRILQNPKAMDTAAEAKLLAPKLVDFKVALVTSVLHMPRAKDLFNAQGIEVITAATDYHNFAVLPWHKQFIPNAQALMVVTQYAHEVIGNAWITVRRWANPEAL